MISNFQFGWFLLRFVFINRTACSDCSASIYFSVDTNDEFRWLVYLDQTTMATGSQESPERAEIKGGNKQGKDPLPSFKNLFGVLAVGGGGGEWMDEWNVWEFDWGEGEGGGEREREKEWGWAWKIGHGKFTFSFLRAGEMYSDSVRLGPLLKCGISCPSRWRISISSTLLVAAGWRPKPGMLPLPTFPISCSFIATCVGLFFYRFYQLDSNQCAPIQCTPFPITTSSSSSSSYSSSSSSSIDYVIHVSWCQFVSFTVRIPFIRADGISRRLFVCLLHFNKNNFKCLKFKILCDGVEGI